MKEKQKVLEIKVNTNRKIDSLKEIDRKKYTQKD